MRAVFIVNGYGIPKDIFTDENYQRYLNESAKIIQASKEKDPLIIVSGGPTDMFPPYDRTEAKEMEGAFRALRGFDPSVEIVLEPKSLTTLENFVFSKQIIQDRGLEQIELHVMCEWTRKERVEKLTERIFGSRVIIHAIDFDQSPNRKLDPKFIKQKEDQALHFELWALESEENMKKYRELAEKKIRTLREAGPDHQVKAIRQYWEKTVADFKRDNRIV